MLKRRILRKPLGSAKAFELIHTEVSPHSQILRRYLALIVFSFFSAGFSHRSQPSSIDLNSVRLCFQVFLENPDRERTSFTVPLSPIVSDPIYDKKAMSDLVICKLSDTTCTVAGGKEIILLCEKVRVIPKGVIQYVIDKRYNIILINETINFR